MCKMIPVSMPAGARQLVFFTRKVKAERTAPDEVKCSYYDSDS